VVFTHVVVVIPHGGGEQAVNVGRRIWVVGVVGHAVVKARAPVTFEWGKLDGRAVRGGEAVGRARAEGVDVLAGLVAYPEQAGSHVEYSGGFKQLPMRLSDGMAAFL
jgi:hypothetical protein